jgi:hypothetical protein
MAPLLTPGLTPFQRQQVADVLTCVGIVPRGLLASLFVDVDVAAARALNSTRPSREDCHSVANELAAAHGIDTLTASFAYGMAIGVRQGRRFAVTDLQTASFSPDDRPLSCRLSQRADVLRRP